MTEEAVLTHDLTIKHSNPSLDEIVCIRDNSDQNWIIARITGIPNAGLYQLVDPDTSTSMYYYIFNHVIQYYIVTNINSFNDIFVIIYLFRFFVTCPLYHIITQASSWQSPYC